MPIESEHSIAREERDGSVIVVEVIGKTPWSNSRVVRECED